MHVCTRIKSEVYDTRFLQTHLASDNVCKDLSTAGRLWQLLASGAWSTVAGEVSGGTKYTCFLSKLPPPNSPFFYTSLYRQGLLGGLGREEHGGPLSAAVLQSPGTCTTSTPSFPGLGSSLSLRARRRAEQYIPAAGARGLLLPSRPPPTRSEGRARSCRELSGNPLGAGGRRFTSLTRPRPTPPRPQPAPPRSPPPSCAAGAHSSLARAVLLPPRPGSPPPSPPRPVLGLRFLSASSASPSGPSSKLTSLVGQGRSTVPTAFRPRLECQLPPQSANAPKCPVPLSAIRPAGLVGSCSQSHLIPPPMATALSPFRCHMVPFGSLRAAPLLPRGPSGH